MNLQLVTAPAGYPVTLQEAKTHMRVDSADEDAYIGILLSAAASQVEIEIGRALITRTYNLLLDGWPSDSSGGEEWWDGEREGSIVELLTQGAKRYIELPYPPISSVTHVKTYDDADVATVFAASNYYVDRTSMPGRIALRTSSAWPIPTRLTNGIEIQWVAGYGATGNVMPDQIKLAIMQLASHWYENREPVISGIIVADIPLTVERILKRLRPVSI